MNSIKFILALAALCMLVMPAFSMLDSGMGQDCKQKMWQGQDDKQKSCDCQKPCDYKEPCDCQKSMMGSDDKQKMWQGKDDEQKPCDCEKSMMGQDDKQKMCQGKDDKQKIWLSKENTCDCQKPCDCKGPCDCQKSMMGPEGKHIKSMMGQDCNPMIHKHIKSMMGDRDGNGKIMIVVVKR
jgi:hypothetical protein